MRSGKDLNIVYSGIALGRLGEIPSDWDHVYKLVTPGEGLSVPRAYLKWYDIHSADLPIESEVRQRAREFLQREAAAGTLALRDEFGFVLLHRSGDIYFLIVCLWRSITELWQVLYFTDSGEFRIVPQANRALRPVQCVWELGPTGYERLAWTRYLVSARDERAKRAYLADRLSGPV